MAVTNKPLIEGTQLTTSVATYYSAPENTSAIIKKLTITNTSGSAVTVTLYLVPSGGTASAANEITSAIPVSAGKAYEAYEMEGHALAPDDSIQALAGAATSLNIRCSGVEIVNS